jgi:NADPH-dependent ferric siderophore reductase
MTLRLYKDSEGTSEVSNGTFANAVKTRHDGSKVDTQVVQLWLKNDNNPMQRKYVNVTVDAEMDTEQFDLEFAPDVAGAAGTWGETAAIGDGEFLSAAPFWVRAVVQPQAEPINFSAAKIKVLSQVESTV